MSSSNNPSQFSKKILVIAKSARMLTSYLLALGYQVVAVDCYGDSDTRRMAADFYLIENLGLEQVGLALAELKNRHVLNAAIYGSGFECYSEGLHFLHAQLPVWGNSPDCFDAVQDKACLFRCFDQLQIDYPPVAFTPPSDMLSEWLEKPLRGEGGLGIRRVDAGKVSKADGVYWQRYVEGEPCSVLFVAGADNVEILGYQQQLIESQQAHEFLFAGVMTRPDFPVSLRQRIEQWAVDFSRCFRLQGLNSLDFIHDRGQCYALEINARPTASLQLYGCEIMTKHIRAVVSCTIEQKANDRHWAAYKIIYASREISIGDSSCWPDWVMDRPAVGAVIGQGGPVCSIIARARNRRQLQESLQHKQFQIEQFLQTGIWSHAI